MSGPLAPLPHEFRHCSWKSDLVPSGSHQYPEVAVEGSSGQDWVPEKGQHSLWCGRPESPEQRWPRGFGSGSRLTTRLVSVSQCGAVTPSPAAHLDHLGCFPKCTSWTPSKLRQVLVGKDQVSGSINFRGKES